MIKLFNISALLVLSLIANLVMAGDYTSLTFKQSIWSGKSYIGDLSDWVYFEKGNASVVEYKSDDDSFSLSAAIRQNENGDTALESLIGATKIKNTYIKLETGGAEGVVYNDNPNEPLLLPENKYFKSQFNMLAIGVDWDRANTGVKYGVAWVNLVQPGEIDLTYYRASASAGYTVAPLWAESAVDPEFSNNLIGWWLDIDSLNAFMNGESTLYSSPTISGNFIRGWALDVEAVTGFYFSQSSLDLETKLMEAYGLDYDYVESSGLGWNVTYKIAYNFVYRKSDDLAFGVQMGVEGRVFQVLWDFSDSSSVSSKSEAIGKIGIGDNSSYQWAPYVRLAMEF